METEAATMAVSDVLRQAQEAMTVRRVVGEPYEKNGVTVIPVAAIRGGGGGGEGTGGGSGEGRGSGTGVGYGMVARPVGVYVVADGRVSWQPAVDVTRVIIGGQAVLIALLATLRATVRARGRRRARG